MNIISRLFHLTFWYRLALDLTITGTLRKTGAFTAADTAFFKEEYRRLVKQNRRMVKDIPSEYHLAWTSAFLAVYRAYLKKGCGREPALQRTEEIIFTNLQAEKITAVVGKALDKAADPFRLMVNNSKNQEKHFYGVTFRFRRMADDENKYDLRVPECFYYNFVRANGAPELMRAVCKWDLVSWGKAIDPEKHGFSFNRPVTLGLDGKECEFTLQRNSDR